MAREANESALLSVAIEDVAVLGAAHMPYIKNGGLFIPTTKSYRLGDEILVLLSLLDAGRIPLAGKVVWITPAGALGGKPQGIGVQFGDQDEIVRQRIDTLLAAYADIATETYTL